MARLRLDHDGFAVETGFGLGGYGVGVLDRRLGRALTLRPGVACRSRRGSIKVTGTPCGKMTSRASSGIEMPCS